MTFAGQPLDYRGPHLSNADAIIPMLSWLARRRVSDVIIRTDDPLFAWEKGRLVAVTNYRLNGSQVERILKKLAGADNVTAKVGAGDDYDRAITVSDPDEQDEDGEPLQHRFRLNITANYAGTALGFDATLRSITTEPPTLDQVAFPSQLRERFAVTQGSFIIAGPTGSGKSTTFAACIREILQGDTPIKGRILTYEAPVEYLFHMIQSAHSVVSQVEIGVHLPSFASGVRNAMRRKPTLAVIGEMRDRETIEAAAELVTTGHPVFATTHANSCVEIIQRLVQKFPVEHYEPMFASIVNASRLLMSQCLVPDQHGQMCVLRDWLYLTNAHKQRLIDTGYRNHLAVLRELIRDPENGQTMRVSIDAAFMAGLFTEAQRLVLLRTYGEDDG